MSVVFGERKSRSDKKKAIAAPLDQIHNDQVTRLSYVCDLPAKVICEILCREAYRDEKLIEELRVHFRRDLLYNENRMFFGDISKDSYRQPKGDKKRVYMRFYQFEHDRFAALAYSLDCSVQVAAALLLTSALDHKRVVYPILARYLHIDLDLDRSKKLRHLCMILDQRSTDKHITIPMVVAHAIKESYERNIKLKQTLNKWSNV